MAARISGVATIACPIMAKDFHRTEMSIGGGRYCHVHYVDWRDERFLEMMEACLSGERPVNKSDILRAVTEPSVGFGRWLGVPLATLSLAADGTIKGSGHPNESFWKESRGSLIFLDSAGDVTTVFDTRFGLGRKVWCVGKCRGGTTRHYLEIKAKNGIRNGG